MVNLWFFAVPQAVAARRGRKGGRVAEKTTNTAEPRGMYYTESCFFACILNGTLFSTEPYGPWSKVHYKGHRVPFETQSYKSHIKGFPSLPHDTLSLKCLSCNGVGFIVPLAQNQNCQQCHGHSQASRVPSNTKTPAARGEARDAITRRV